MLESVVEMILQRCISLLMAALVLACPFCDCGECCGMCLPSACVEPDGCDEAGETVCACGCEHEAQLPCDHNVPEDSKHFDCFCDGAVLSDSTNNPGYDLDRGLVAVLGDDSEVCESTGTRASDPSLLHGSHFPPLLSGRDICTLLGSHLL